MYKTYLVNMTNGTGVTTPVFLRWRFRNHQRFVRIWIWATLVSRGREKHSIMASNVPGLVCPIPDILYILLCPLRGELD